MPAKRLAFDLKAATVRAHAGRFHRDLLHAQNLDPEDFRRLQAERTSSIVRFAFDHTAFYRDWFTSHGFTRESAADPAAWESLPVLTRAIVKENAPRFLTPDATPGNSRDAQTGGSTGEPLRTRHDARVPSLAFSWRMYSWWGVAPWDNLARIGRWNFGPRAVLRNRVEWWPTRQLYLDAGLIDPASMARFADEFVRVRPVLFEGYVGAMLEFADFVERHGIELPRPRAIATTAAPLTESARLRLTQVFGAPVYNEYRGSEVGWMAGECAEQDGLHVFADWRRLDILDEHGAVAPVGTLGDVVITDLGNRVFPLIRYRLGDKAAAMEGLCGCGRVLPRIAPPEGRVTDVLRLPGGGVLAHRLMGMFSSAPDSVRLFQIHQSADYAITVRVVLGDTPTAREDAERAVAALRDRIAAEVPVTLAVVDELPYTGGKTKYVISDVPTPAA